MDVTTSYAADWPYGCELSLRMSQVIDYGYGFQAPGLEIIYIRWRITS